MKYRIYVISVLLFVVVGIGLFILLSNRKGEEMEVNLEYIDQYSTNNENASYWSCIISKEHSIERKLNISIPDNDFNNYYLVYSTGKKITKLTYNTKEFLSYDASAYRGYPVFDEVFYPNTVFFYRIPKIKVYPDLSYAPEK